jgi:putative transposase
MQNSDKNATSTDLTYGRGYVYSLQYHLVWCTKYRKGVLVGNIAEEIQASLKTTAEELGIAIDVMEVMPDHIHMLIHAKPQLRLSDAIKIMKGNSARWLFLAHPEIKKQLWGGHLWNPSYCVVTVSDRSHDQVKRYIETQKSR